MVCSGRLVGKDSSDFSAANSRGQLRVHDLEDVLWAPEVPQAVLAEIEQLVPVVPHELSRGDREHDLVTVSNRHEPGRAVERPP